MAEKEKVRRLMFGAKTSREEDERFGIILIMIGVLVYAGIQVARVLT